MCEVALWSHVSVGYHLELHVAMTFLILGLLFLPQTKQTTTLNGHILVGHNNFLESMLILIMRNNVGHIIF